MSLAPGTKLRHYEIIDALGASVQGEVYRARDTKLGREVAKDSHFQAAPVARRNFAHLMVGSAWVGGGEVSRRR